MKSKIAEVLKGFCRAGAPSPTVPRVAAAVLVALCARGLCAGEIRPGEIWRDTSGYAINAHGGGVMWHEGTYYWYGEHKVYGKAGSWAHVGVHVYSSTNLVDWTDRGLALAVEPDPTHLIGDGCIIERPKAVFCRKTRKFALYFHLEYRERSRKLASAGIAESDTPCGPFRFVRAVRPHGADCRDMNLFTDDDGSVWHVFSSERNKVAHLERLTDDCLDYAGETHRIFIGDATEALALFRHGGHYWCLGSGCTGWRPNEARLYRAEKLAGPWTRLGNPCTGVNPQNGLGPEKTWGGQSTAVLRITGTDRFIALFDLWKPENQLDSRYLWLPIEFRDGTIEIPWRNSWNCDPALFRGGLR